MERKKKGVKLFCKRGRELSKGTAFSSSSNHPELAGDVGKQETRREQKQVTSSEGCQRNLNAMVINDSEASASP